ncbi:hypothetical protein D9619_001653 [Psilocybe cf. subviscida]|uniref:Uncharacterized protein n=1 Tax=Psilocybe cf. subviscida TaxID=2480587 RepID=A0A8H5BFV9_9AGAR|nr:hypothetical protein D9619_001653 [Psilocybe cf. subviscida]
MPPPLSRTCARANVSLVASRKLLASRLASTQAADTSTRREENPGATWTAFIRTWRPPTGVSEALLILAEIEKKYGKIRESHFLKDYEVPQKYQMLAYVVFEDPQSLDRIPRGGVDHAVDSSLPDRHEPHSLSLQQVEALVYPTNSAVAPSSTTTEDKDRVLGFRLIPAGKEYVDPKHVNASVNRIYQTTPGPIMENFYRWGGFHSEEPLELPSKQFGVEELFNPKQVQPNIRMRAALKLCEMNRKHNRMLFGAGIETINRPRTNSPAPTPVSSEPTEQPPTPAPVPESIAPSEEQPKTTPKSKKSTSAISPLDTAPTPVPEEKKPELSPEQKDALANQLKAARELRKSTVVASKLPSINIPPSLALPTRRKQAKPRPVRTYIEIAKADPQRHPLEEKKGILDKLWGFVGKKS